MLIAIVLAPVLVPVSVRVRFPSAASTMEPVLLKLSGPVPDDSIAALPPRVKRRFVLAAGPVYLSVPPVKTRSPGPLLAAPIGPATPALGIELTTSVPALTVVTPL